MKKLWQTLKPVTLVDWIFVCVIVWAFFEALTA
jgi:hypothetical protein